MFRVIHCFFLAHVLIDAITGFLLLTGTGIRLSFALKIISLALIVLVLVRDRDFADSLLFLAAVYLVSISHGLSITTNAFVFISESFTIIYPLIIYKYIERYYHQRGREAYAANIMNINLLVFVMNFLLGLAGFGFGTYGKGKIGIKGFFFGGNEVGVLFFCFFVYWYATHERKALSAAVSLAAAVLIGTKGAVGMVILFLAFDRFMSLKRNIMTVIYLGLMAVVVYLAALRFMQTDFWQYQAERFNWTYRLTGSWLDAISSNRTAFMARNIDYMMTHFSVISILFGHGLQAHLAEIDIADALFVHGLIIGSMVICFYFRLLSQSKKNRYLFLFNLIYLITALSAGHVWYNTTAALFFVIMNTCEVLKT